MNFGSEGWGGVEWSVGSQTCEERYSVKINLI